MSAVPVTMLGAWHGAPAYALGLAATLVLAAWLTPAHWWRRPTARGLAVLGGGTWLLGGLLLAGLGAAQGPSAQAAGTPVALAHEAPVQHPARPAADRPGVPAPGQRYRVHRALNVRAGAGIGAERLATVPSGALVTATGRQDGDWWQVRFTTRESATGDSATGASAIGASAAGRSAAGGSTSGGADRTGWASSLWLRRAVEQAGQR